MRQLTLVALVALTVGCGPSCPGSATPAKALQWPEADALFHRDAKWLGADAASSIVLGPNRTLWLFGDTFVATSPANKRSESKMVRTTIAIQTGTDPTTATMAFAWN